MLYGRAARPPTGKIRTSTAGALLAVRPSVDTLPGTSPTDATGTRRRLQALTVNGWSAARLATRLGMEPTHLRRIIRGGGKNKNVSVATARAVRDLYDELWDQPPPEVTHREKVAASKTRNRAAGWVPAQAWDDDEIDDPAAVPATGWERRDGVRRYGILGEEVTELIGFGEEPWRAAERLGVSQRTLERALADMVAGESRDTAA